MKKALVVLAVFSQLVACGGSTDVAGNYTVALTNRENGCAFTDWEEGKTSSGIPLDITQDGNHVTAVVGGLAGVFLDLWLGEHTYTGTVSGSHLELTLYGKNPKAQGNCTYTINSEIDAEVDGDILQGEIFYTAATNQNPDCGTLQDCRSRQQFNGTRPPK